MSTDGIFAFLGLACALASGGFAVGGWLTNRPDGAVRFRRRVWTWIFFLGFIGFAAMITDHWFLLVLDVLAAVWALGKVAHWWRQLELVRRFDREVARSRMVKRVQP